MSTSILAGEGDHPCFLLSIGTSYYRNTKDTIAKACILIIDMRKVCVIRFMPTLFEHILQYSKQRIV